MGRWILAVDPDDSRVEYQLGRLYEDSDPSQGVRHLRRATELSPNVQRYWAHLAAICESIGDTNCADRTWEALAKLCPVVPLYHWQAGKSYLHTNQLIESLAQFQRLLDLDPQYAPQIWYALRELQTPDTIFQELLADRADSKIKVKYADFLSGQGDDNDAYRVWRQLAVSSSSFPFSSVKPYLERLITLDRIDEAESVWLDLQRLGVIKTSQVDNKRDNLIFNGDFEQFPLNAGFDWRSGPITYLSVDFSATGAHHGAHCLRVDFTVSRNEEYEPVYQLVPVLPNHTYKLEAYTRSEGITSDTGPYLRVSDTRQPSFPDALSETTVGTTPWHRVRLYFSTGPETQTVRLSIWRPRGRTFPTEISGAFWLDAVTLQSSGYASESIPEQQH